jgi:uncharacterized membrane protein YdjX (TVP38/TMEM64 family)
MKSEDKKTRLVLTFSFFVNIIFFVVGIIFISRTDITVLRNGMDEFGIIAPIIYIVLYTGLFIVPFNPVPKNVLTYFALASFGPFEALIYTLLGDFIGVSINYFWAKKFEMLIPDQVKEKLSNLKGNKRWFALILSRISPVLDGFVAADYPSYIAGLIKMPYFLFILITIFVWGILETVYFYGLNILIMDPTIMGIIVAVMIFSLSYTLLTFLEKRS